MVKKGLKYTTKNKSFIFPIAVYGYLSEPAWWFSVIEKNQPTT